DQERSPQSGRGAPCAPPPSPRSNPSELPAGADPSPLAGPPSVAEALRQRERQLAEAQQLAGLGSWEWDIAADRVSWSDELYRIYGVTPETFAGSYGAFLDCVHPEDRARTDEIIRRSYETGEPFDFEHRIVCPDGSVRTLQARGRVVLDERER